MIAQATSKLGARHVDMTADEYHAHPAYGSSMLEDFRKSRRLFHAVHIAKTEPPREATDAMDFGTLVNTRLLEPHRWDEVVAEPMPEKAPDGTDWNRRKTAHREAWAEAESERSGIILGPGDLRRVDRVCEAIKSNWHARRILEGDGEAEYSIFWTDRATGLECKCRLDWFSTISIDLKTTARIVPADYAKQVVNLGYHRKRAHYLAGLSALLDEPNPPFIHLVAEVDSPFRVACYDLEDIGPDGGSLGVDQRRSTLWELAKCLDSGDWREPWEKQVCTLQLPRYAWTESEYSF